MQTILSGRAESMVLSQPASLLHALFLKSKNIFHLGMSGLICWCLETWIASELPWVKLGFNRQATEYLLSHIWDCHYRAEALAKGNGKGMWLSGVESMWGNRGEQGDKMEGKINSEDSVFVSRRHVSVGNKNNLYFIFISAVICAFHVFKLSHLVHYFSMVLVFQQNWNLRVALAIVWTHGKDKNILLSRHLVITYNIEDSV